MTSRQSPVAQFWICEVLGGQMLTGHADYCPFFIRQRQRDPNTPCKGPFANKRLVAAAVKQSDLPFRWCKSCQNTQDVTRFSELNLQFDSARSEYSAALDALSKSPETMARFKAASDRLGKLLRGYALFLRKNQPGLAMPAQTERLRKAASRGIG
jgi:hypothetical protein